MLVVKIEMWPGGNEGKAYLLSQGVIANDGKGSVTLGSVTLGNYDVNLMKAPRFGGDKKPRISGKSWRRGRVEGFDRNLSEWELLRRALEDALEPGDRKNRRA